jgi:hypothetical protein
MSIHITCPPIIMRWKTVPTLINTYGLAECTHNSIVEDVGRDEAGSASIGPRVGVDNWAADTKMGVPLVLLKPIPHILEKLHSNLNDPYIIDRQQLCSKNNPQTTLPINSPNNIRHSIPS